VIDQYYFLSALTGNRGTHHAGGASADYGDIILFLHRSIINY